MCLARDNIEERFEINDLSYPTMPVNTYTSYNYTDYDNFSDVDEWDNLSDFYASDENYDQNI